MDAQGRPIRSAHQAAVPAGAVTAAAPCTTWIVMRAGPSSVGPGRPGDEPASPRRVGRAAEGRQPTIRRFQRKLPTSGWQSTKRMRPSRSRPEPPCFQRLGRLQARPRLVGQARPATRRRRPGGWGELPRAGSQQLDDFRQSGCDHRAPGPGHPVVEDSADSSPCLL